MGLASGSIKKRQNRPHRQWIREKELLSWTNKKYRRIVNILISVEGEGAFLRPGLKGYGCVLGDQVCRCSGVILYPSQLSILSRWPVWISFLPLLFFFRSSEGTIFLLPVTPPTFSIPGVVVLFWIALVIFVLGSGDFLTFSFSSTTSGICTQLVSFPSELVFGAFCRALLPFASMGPFPVPLVESFRMFGADG